MNHMFKDISGQRFGYLRAVSLHPERTAKGQAVWVCLCDCGNTKNCPGILLRNGFTRSCGCYRRSAVWHITHGRSGTPEYIIWGSIINRCTCKQSYNFKSYGGRGISVCDRWRKFENFFADMGTRPSPHLTVERVDNEKPYSPANCIWATRKDQARNRRGNRRLTFNGKTLTVAEWSEITGIHTRTIRARLDVQNWSVEDALTGPVAYSRFH